MMQQLAMGWKNVVANKATVFLVSLYQMLWTILIYILIDRSVSPLVRALPDESVSSLATNYFWLETRFNLAKTDLILPYLYVLIALLIVRMILTPLIQCGTYGTLANSHQRSETGTNFVNHVKQQWKPFVLMYWLKTIAILVPTVTVFVPIIKSLRANYFALSVEQLPLIQLSLLLLWSILVSCIAYCILLGIVKQLDWKQSLMRLMSRAVKLITIALTIASVAFTLNGLLQVTTFFLVGIISTLLFFIVPIIRTFFKAWTISTHMLHYD